MERRVKGEKNVFQSQAERIPFMNIFVCLRTLRNKGPSVAMLIWIAISESVPASPTRYAGAYCP